MFEYVMVFILLSGSGQVGQSQPMKWKELFATKDLCMDFEKERAPAIFIESKDKLDSIVGYYGLCLPAKKKDVL